MAPHLLFTITIFLAAAAVAAAAGEAPLPAFFPRAVPRQAVVEGSLRVGRGTKDQPKAPPSPYAAHFFPQQLDHFTFRPEGYATFPQKYLMNSRYWDRRGGAPIFVYTGNEGNIEWFADNTGFLLDIAPKFRALLVFIEHRFYGESVPFGPESYTSPEKLGYLSSAQALADYALLIRSLKQNLSAEASPVVVFGGSYGGSELRTRFPIGDRCFNGKKKTQFPPSFLGLEHRLHSCSAMHIPLSSSSNLTCVPPLSSFLSVLAAWFRLKYPHIAIGALASSAPILQFDDITPATSFYDGVSQNFKDESLNCLEAIKGSWDELMTKASKKGGMVEISQMFKACKKQCSGKSTWCRPIQSVYSARDWLWSAFVYTAMVDYPTAANFMKPLPAYPVKEMCKIIDRSPAGVDKLTKAIAAAGLYYNYTGSQTCFQIGNEPDAHGLHGWNFQACTEMVMGMSCSNESMFPPYTYSYKDFAESCKARYGVAPRPHWITSEYGGNRIEQVLKRFGSNIIFSNGMRDPWSRGGVLKSISDSLVALVTDEGAHHVDFRSATKDDPAWLVELRRQEIGIIQKWVDEYHAGS
ncbi:hypothetical protein Taro_029569 [Colocasia esculenta]|uniref:Lysosomal Pro-X carboxypeptidase n=1 Tax=Colocasia esculenta TaxID=4460 RepID=A0A843VPF0_COLES|nr:hypothetical protein [Colocasia esculenta]